MRGSPFLMPVYEAGVAFWQGCAAVKSGMLHGGVLPLMLVCGGLRCEAAGVVMGVAGAWLGGAAGCVAECADLCVGTRGRNIERQGRGEQRKKTPVWNKCPECYTEDRQGAENSCLWKCGKMLENLDFH